MFEMHSVILRVWKEVQTKREIAAKAEESGLQSKRASVPPALYYPTGGRQIDLKPFLAPAKKDGVEGLCLLQVLYFVSNLQICHASHGGIGVTWLELLAKFEHDGGRLDPICMPRGGLVAPSLRVLLLKFKQLVKFIIQVCADDAASIAFSPCKSGYRRLRSLGFTTFIPAINFGSRSLR